MDTSVAIQLIILLILLILSGFFSSAETALTTVNRMRIRGLADEGSKRAKTVMRITDDTSKMLSAILIPYYHPGLQSWRVYGGSGKCSSVCTDHSLRRDHTKDHGYTACGKDVSSLCSGHKSVHQSHDTICIYHQYAVGYHSPHSSHRSECRK